MFIMKSYKTGRILTFIFLFVVIASLIPDFYTADIARRKTLRSATEYAEKLRISFKKTTAVFPSNEDKKEVILNLGVFFNKDDASKFVKTSGFKNPIIRSYAIYKIYLMYLPNEVGYFIEKNSLSYLIFFTILLILYIWLYRLRRKNWLNNINEKTWLAMR